MGRLRVLRENGCQPTRSGQFGDAIQRILVPALFSLPPALFIGLRLFQFFSPPGKIFDRLVVAGLCFLKRCIRSGGQPLALLPGFLAARLLLSLLATLLLLGSLAIRLLLLTFLSLLLRLFRGSFLGGVGARLGRLLAGFWVQIEAPARLSSTGTFGSLAFSV